MAILEGRVRIPRDKDNDYTHEMAARRREFVAEQTGADLSHVGKYSFDPSILPGNIENFLGVAQVPIGLAGPLRIRGEHATGEFFVPLATSEGSLDENLAAIRAAAEATTRSGKLVYIGQYAVGPLRYLRFNYTTGDATGQNMTGKATFAACEWIKKNYPRNLRYILSGGIDTDKKHSHINILLTRGKRVVAEAVVQKDALQRLMGVDTKDLFWSRQLQLAGGFLTGSANNGAQSANALAALFIATGQDVANIAESQAAITYSQLLDNGDYYWSITLTSLIVATYGGGTGLATQKECLDVLGRYRKGKANKFAEICAAVVLAGETSLASAGAARRQGVGARETGTQSALSNLAGYT